MPIELYPNIAKVKRNSAWQNLPGFVEQSGDADIEAMIANKETSTTAQFAHAKDSLFILNDILYQADTNIKVNDAIVTGTNCHVTNIASELYGLIANSSDAEEAIEKITDVSISPNLFNPETLVRGYISNSNGSIGQSGDWYTTDFIPVEYGENYSYSGKENNARIQSYFYFNLEYDSNKNPITASYGTTAKTKYTPSSISTKYLRFSFHMVDTITERCFQKGNDITYEPYGEKTYRIKEEANTQNVLELIEYSDIKQNSNLYDKTKAKAGYISNQAGNISVTGDWEHSDFIPVEYGKTYVAYNDTARLGIYFVQECDENTNGISYNGNGTNPYTPSSANVKFFRFCYHQPATNNIVFEEGTQAKCLFTPYGKTIVPEYRNLLLGKKWVALGDSLTEKNPSATSNYTDFISWKNNMDIVNMGVGGTGYMRGYDSSNAFYQRAANIPDCDIITIFGSGNDLALYSVLGDITDTTTDTICGCMNKTLDVIFANHPTTPLLVIAPTPWAGNTPDMATGMSLYCEKLAAICARRGVAYLDLFHHSGLRPDDVNQRDLVFYDGSLDGNPNYVHPNKLGHSIIAPRIMQAMESVIIF